LDIFVIFLDITDFLKRNLLHLFSIYLESSHNRLLNINFRPKKKGGEKNADTLQ
jgi:hypothetical protein